MPRKRLALVCLLALMTVGVAAAPANPGEKVELELTAKAFKEKDLQTLEVHNKGNVEWTITMDWKVESGTWSWPNLEFGCTPDKVAAGKSCTVKVECVKAGKLKWTATVVTASKTKSEKSMDLICTAP